MLTKTSRPYRIAVAACLVAAHLLVASGRARAAPPTFQGTRPLGMGGALRANAAGSAGPLLNPSGMSLTRSYVVEGAYQYTDPGPAHVGHVSIVDSTSGFNLAGGLYYTYLNAEGVGAARTSGHEGGVALSVPFGEKLALGVTGKYVALASGPSAERTRVSGITVDAGITVRAVPFLNVGVVGYNLRALRTGRHPRSLGWGVGLNAVPGLTLEVDGLVDLRADDEARSGLDLMGGAEYVLAQRIALRAGGGRIAEGERSFFTLGASLLSEVGALDAGFQQDIGGVGKQTLFAVSARLFVPSP